MKERKTFLWPKVQREENRAAAAASSFPSVLETVDLMTGANVLTLFRVSEQILF